MNAPNYDLWLDTFSKFTPLFNIFMFILPVLGISLIFDIAKCAICIKALVAAKEMH